MSKHQRILIIGATSAMAEATARAWQTEGPCRFHLLARDAQKLQAISQDLQARGAEVASRVLDILQTEQHAPALAEAWQYLGEVDIVLIAAGTLPDQAACAASVSETELALRSNGLAIVLLLTELANRLQAQQHGTLAVISSVAGDRGRASNYVYGAAKAMVSTCLSGLTGRLAAHGITVLDIKPGFVDSPMTAHLSKGGPLWATPAQVAQDIVRAVRQRRHVIYTPWFWRWIMLIIQHIPLAIFKKLRF
ncbi:SDR family oxidoreductase [Parvibium lacunae]|uniref:Short-chain dehydrogenase n=1 Tax=Parvibium lacunae TaxID=1888893 RepID=A0A368L0S7_9BURK|nr:SDR family oxidoreductase [Parvibium lacunae]RCS56679.1 short-chain dehydrogenase [Parvibium lacunae]